MILSSIKYTRLFSGNSNELTSPGRLIIQIILLQCFYYLTAFVMFYLISKLNGYEFSISWVFSWELVSSDNTLGLFLFVLWLLDSLMCVLFVTFIVGRSKLAWDFALTIHIINLLVVWLYTGKFPSSALWWCLQVFSATSLVVLSTYSTRWNELRTTFFDNMLDQQERGESHTLSNSEAIEMRNIT